MFAGHLFGDVGSAAEFLDGFDNVVGRHHQHHRRRILGGDECGPQADAGGRIPAKRLTDNMAAG